MEWGVFFRNSEVVYLFVKVVEVVKVAEAVEVVEVL